MDKASIHKTVQFNDFLEVHTMCVWSTASRLARKGEWQQLAVDRVRFKRRIQMLDLVLSPVLKKKIEDTVTSRTEKTVF